MFYKNPLERISNALTTNYTIKASPALAASPAPVPLSQAKMFGQEGGGGNYLKIRSVGCIRNSKSQRATPSHLLYRQ